MHRRPSLADTRILILTTFDLDEYVHEALCAGASGFLLKDTEPPDLIDAVRVIAAGDALISPKFTRRLIEQFARVSEERQVDPVIGEPSHRAPWSRYRPRRE